MKKYSKGFISGIMVAVLVFTLIGTAFAKSEKVMQELTYRNIRVSLDGKVLDLRNAIGEPVEPFMFNGTNYLPVRALAEALGLNVAWDGKEVMVVLTTPETAQTENPAPVPVTRPATGTQSGNLGKYHVEIKGARLAEGEGGSTAIVVTFAWTNNSEKTTSASLSFMESAFQNGIEIDTAYPNGYSVDAYNKDIRPGATLEVERAFKLTSATALVEVEITEFLGNDDEVVQATFNPAELKFAS